jgi:hypothetical protein
MAICLAHRSDGPNPHAIRSKTRFYFVCISSITKTHPFDPTKQVLLDHHDPNLGLSHPSAACVDFAPCIEVTIERDAHVLAGVRTLTTPVQHRVPVSPTFQAILALFQKYWLAVHEANVANNRANPPRNS